MTGDGVIVMIYASYLGLAAVYGHLEQIRLLELCEPSISALVMTLFKNTLPNPYSNF
jgi:hypothetical protein